MARFRSKTVDSEAQAVGNGPIDVNVLSVLNDNSSPIFVKVYNKATEPDENDTPIEVFQCPADDQIFLSALQNDLNAEVKMWVRAVTGFADDNATDPSILPIISIVYDAR